MQHEEAEGPWEESMLWRYAERNLEEAVIQKMLD